MVNLDPSNTTNQKNETTKSIKDPLIANTNKFDSIKDETDQEIDVLKILDSENEDVDILWEETGFQRILGGFFHNYIFNLAIMVFGLIFLGLIFPKYILPFPEALGFKSVVSSLFALLFTIFDVGIGSSVTRFVAEYVGRGEVKKGMEYLRFFIWFQMFTGLIQITIIAYWALHIAINSTNFAPLIWFFLINSCVQYPGMLGIYSAGLEAFQRYDKKNIVAFVQQVFFEMTTQIVFIFVGRWVGIQNPALGELMGATMGYIIGLYLDDFMAMVLAGYFFQGVLKKYNISIWETFIPDFSRDVIKNAFSFGAKNMAQGIFYQFSMLWITAVTMLWLPNYATIVGLFGIADSLTRVIIQDLPTKAAISEAYNSGKLHLTDYIIQSQFKWYGILTPFLALEVAMLVPPAIGYIAENYAAAAWMIPYLMISRFFIPPIHFSDSVQQGADKPEYAAYSLLVQMITRMITFTLLLNPDLIPSLFETYNYAIAYLLADFPSVIAKNIFAWWLIDRKIIKVRINVWQTLIAPLISIIPLIPINILLRILFFTYASDTFSAILIAIGFILFILFGAPILVVFPMLGLVSGWDERGLIHLKQAAKISGPSKLFTKSLYKASEWGYNHSPLRALREDNEWFKIPYKKADLEAIELMQSRGMEIRI